MNEYPIRFCAACGIGILDHGACGFCGAVIDDERLPEDEDDK